MKPIHGGDMRRESQRYNIPEDEIVDFSANINPLGLPQNTRKAILKSLSSLTRYPDSEAERLRIALSKFHDVDSRNLLVGNGSIDLIYNIAKALSPKRALIPIPTFSEYEISCKLYGSRCLFLDAKPDDFRISVDELSAFIPRVEAVFICNPNNPTSFLFTKDELSFLLKRCARDNAFIIIDEVFIEFVKGYKDIEMVREASRKRNILVLKSLTKYFALPGLRLGYVVGHGDALKKISDFQTPWSVNSIAQVVGREVIRDKAYIDKTRKLIFKERDFLYKALLELKGLRPFEPQANFIFCKIADTRMNSRRLKDLLGRRGITIRDCSNFRGLDDRYIRIAVKRRQENVRLLTALKEIMD